MQGFGNVGSWAAEMLHYHGAKYVPLFLHLCIA